MPRPSPTCLPVLVSLAACQAAPAALDRPNRILLLGDGRALVSDFHHQRMVVFGRHGAAPESWGEQGLSTGGLWQVYALAADPAGSGVWVANMRITSPRDTTSLWEIKRFADGVEHEVHLLAPPAGAGGQWIESLVPEDDGWLVVDSEADALLRYDASWKPGEPVTAPHPGPESTTPAPFAGLAGARRVGDDLWTVEQRGHRIRLLDSGLRELHSFGEDGRGPGELRFPQALAVCPERWVAVADLGNYRVQRFDLTGRYLDGFEPAALDGEHPLQLLDIAVSPDCQQLYLVDSKGGRVLVTTPEGALLETWDGWG